MRISKLTDAETREFDAVYDYLVDSDKLHDRLYGVLRQLYFQEIDTTSAGNALAILVESAREQREEDRAEKRGDGNPLYDRKAGA